MPFQVDSRRKRDRFLPLKGCTTCANPVQPDNEVVLGRETTTRTRMPRLTSLLSKLADPSVLQNDLKLPIGAWAGGLAVALLCILVAETVRQRLGFLAERRGGRHNASSRKGRLRFALSALCCLLCLLYPGALFHTYFHRRVSKEANGFRSACATAEFTKICATTCNDLLVRPIAPADRVTRALFIALICFIPCVCCALPVAAGFARRGVDKCWGRTRHIFSHGDGDLHASDESDGERTASSADEVSLPSRLAHGSKSYDMVAVSRLESVKAWHDCCSICLDRLWTRKNVELACGHRFHRDCVRKWLSRAPVACCPLCKAPVASVERKR